MKNQNESQYPCRVCSQMYHESEYHVRTTPTGCKVVNKICKECQRVKMRKNKCLDNVITQVSKRERINKIPHEKFCEDCPLYKVTTSWHYPTCYYACLRREDLD